MYWIKLFFIQNFALFCISIFIIVNSIIRYKQHKKISLFSILVVSFAILSAVCYLLQEYGRVKGIVPLATIITIVGYLIRPVCIYLFIMMSGSELKGKLFFLNYLPLLINAIFYIFALIPQTKGAVFYYTPKMDGTLDYVGGPLRFSSHIISAIYLGYLLYVSFVSISSKHLSHGLTILAVSLFVVAAVVIEAFFNENNDIYILNTTIGVGAMCYYLYLYIEMTQIDVLTGLFNRETYYQDLHKMDRVITGVIEFDMNGLKYLNDNFGHIEGDKGLITIAKIISSCAKRNMYVYRLGGDEFVLLCANGREEDIVKVVNTFKEELSHTDYYCSIGYACRTDKTTPVKDLIKYAEFKLYQDKEAFYENSPFERRRANK